MASCTHKQEGRTPWDPERYHQFRDERFAPFADLASLITARPGLRVIDLGCGTGELTRRLADMLPDSEVLGVDNSPQMLAGAQSQARPGLRFMQADLAEVSGEWDLVFSHAAIQWVDDHDWLVPRLLGLAVRGGQLAVQLPSNHNHATHTLVRELAQAEPFCSALGGWVRTSPVLPVDRYAELLYAAGGRALAVWEKVYAHVLADADALADWMAGTALVPYFERLDADLREEFMARYRARLQELWREKPVFYPFRRILFAATRS